MKRSTSVETSNTDTLGALALVTYLLALAWLANSLFSTVFPSSSLTVLVAQVLVYGSIFLFVVLTLAYVVLGHYGHAESP